MSKILHYKAPSMEAFIFIYMYEINRLREVRLPSASQIDWAKFDFAHRSVLFISMEFFMNISQMLICGMCINLRC